MPSELHLVAGSTGAGKTTYALALARREGALHLSIDEWMTTLFGPDQVGPPDFGWMIGRVMRCEVLMGRMVRQAAVLGVPVVADCGFTRADQRARWRDMAADAGIAVRLHHLDLDAETRWRRVEGRNREKGETFRLEVTREMFDFVEGLWEPPTAAELAAMNGVRIAP